MYIGFSVLGKITKGIDEEKEIAKGNTAVGILVAWIFIPIGIVVQSGITGVSFMKINRMWMAYASGLPRKVLYYGNDFFEAACARKSFDATQLNGGI